MKRILFSLFLFLASIVVFADGGFTVADVFTDHMVLQRNANVKIWERRQTVRRLKCCLKDTVGKVRLLMENGWSH